MLLLSFLMSLPDQVSEQQTESLQVGVVQLQEHHYHGHRVLLIVDHHRVGAESDEHIRSFSYSLSLLYDYAPFAKDKFFYYVLAM